MSNRSVATIKGNKIGPWKLGETLGLGSTGKVQLAHNETTNQQAAIKVISKAIFNAKVNSKESALAASTPDSLPYGIEREIIIMKLLNHPNVLRLYDVWETNSNLYMVLEYAQKGELFNLLVERGPLPENEAIRFFRQIVIGISYCHALGIVHRDLKPENLLLDHKFNIKIADFGMAALETEDKLLETSCGSPHYAAPEIVSGIPYHGFASDVWSCGVILFALLTGRLPFDDEDGNIRNLLLQVQSGKFQMPDEDEISKDAQDLISRILTVDPEKRIKARDILKHPLLQKYPSINDSKSIRNLPREDTYLHPLSGGDSAPIDESILQNLVVLWHGRNEAEIITKLKEPGANAEKTLYALLDRFKNDTEKDIQKQAQARKRHSLTSAATQATNKKAAPKPNNNISPKRKNRNSVISVSSSHKRPVSFNRLSNVVTTSSVASSNSNTPSKRLSMNLSSNKRLSAVYTNNSSPTPASRHKRVSVVELEKSGDTPPVPIEMLKDYSTTAKHKRLSRNSMRLSFKPTMKRGSITTKLISTYAKLSEDNDWEYIEKETKRTSSDFATLCDQIFEHEKFEQIRKEKEELERKVREAKEREERERREREEEEKRKIKEQQEMEIRQLEMQQQMDEEVALLKKELQNEKFNDEELESDDKDVAVANGRSVSAPLEKKAEGSFADLQANIDDLLRQRTLSLQTRPVSRLDPGVFYSDSANGSYNTRAESENQRLNSDKIILETIRRSKFLGSSFDIQKEFELAKKEEEKKYKHTADASDRVISMTNERYETQVLPKNATATAALKDHDYEAQPRKLSDIKVPQFTRKSRHFSDSNKRLSVLSLYSTKQSYSNLANILNDEKANLKVNYDSPTDNSGQEPEFLFETAQEEGEYTGDSSNDGRLYEVPEDSVATKDGLRLNFADRFKNCDAEGKRVEDRSVKLPTLPPLDSTEASGLGIYQSSSESLEEPAKAAAEPVSVSSSHRQSLEDKGEPKPAAQPKKKEESLNKSMPKRRADEAKRVQEPERKPLKEVPEKNRNTSFFRKFSKSSSADKENTGYDAELYASVSSKQLFNGLRNLMQGWTKYGLKDVKVMPESLTLTGKLSSENILSLRSTLFEMVVWSRGNASVVGFRKKSGSTKTLKRLVNEIEKVLVKEGVLKA